MRVSLGARHLRATTTWFRSVQSCRHAVGVVLQHLSKMRLSRETLKKRTRAYALNYTCGKDICKLRVKTSQTIHLGCDTKRVWVSSTVQVFFFTPLPFFFSFFFFFVRRRWHQTRSWINEGNNWSGVQMSRSIPKKNRRKALTSGYTRVYEQVTTQLYTAVPTSMLQSYHKTQAPRKRKTERSLKKKVMTKQCLYITYAGGMALATRLDDLFFPFSLSPPSPLFFFTYFPEK